MKLRGYTGSNGSVLILDAGGAPPDRREWQLLCCRSLTLPVELLLVGPIGTYPPYQAAAMDLDGLPVPLTLGLAQVFGMFLRDEGYGGQELLLVTDGERTFPVTGEGHGWWAVRPPEGMRLRRLLGL